jgi:hypothetical protein
MRGAVPTLNLNDGVAVSSVVRRQIVVCSGLTLDDRYALVPVVTDPHIAVCILHGTPDVATFAVEQPRQRVAFSEPKIIIHFIA